MSAYDYITINGSQIRRPVDFKPKHEDLLKGEYTTCTGKVIADRIGWKFGDMTLAWEALPQSMVDVLVNITGPVTMVFDDMDGTTYTETIIRDSIVSLRNRNTIDGVVYWRDVDFKIRFINAHTD